MLPEYFAVVGAIIASLGGLYYLYQTIEGTVKPNRVTWLLWALFPMIIFGAQRVQGVEGVSWASFVAGFGPLIVVTASFLNKNAYWQTQKLDYLCMAAGFAGIALWALTKEPNLAIAFSILADFAAGVPTFVKTFKHPLTESWVAYAISTVGFGVSILAIHVWTFENYAFLVYLVMANGLLSLFASRKIRIKN
jgi:hypothetical protein